MKDYGFFIKDIREIVENCEAIQTDDNVSDYSKERAMIHAYEDIADICNWIKKKEGEPNDSN